MTNEQKIAIALVFGGHLHDIPEEDLGLLASDIDEVCDEISADHLEYGAVELRSRIGGAQNIAAYVKCLHAGAGRKKVNK
ncbi:MAG: hypothetical protein RBT60_14810 [Candidatus Krumholzibacteria bacterium]|nr:hypothetical protein [Candidatus Krumholzibacteria bacterium]